MKKVRIALIQMKVCRDTAVNLRTAETMIRQAAERADIVVLPEMFCCLYTNKAFVAAKEPKGGRIWSVLQKAAAENHVYLIGGSMPEEEDGRIYNTCFVFDREGKQIARHRKVHLFDIDIEGGQHFRESDTFTPGHSYTVFDTEFGKMGVEICFDIRFQELARITALAGAKMIFIPAAFNMTTGPAHWELHFRGRAVDNQVFVCGCAPARDENGPYISYGNSIAVSPWGDVTGRLDEKEGILYQEPDLDLVNSIRAQLPIMKNRRTDLYEVEWKQK
ncbi:MAG: carbon-nitrogen hydrolase family protein [Lachnospiraceae bacterium]|nr:carbon-nitrogen hydrolase family protein [Lachnospiraceae bacterium]